VEEARASRTALAAAAYRAAHQVVEQGRIFRDPLALRILGADAEALVRDQGADVARRMRVFIAARSRFAEDRIVTTIERGLRQVVILGAGLDTFAYRTPAREGLRIFEVDHPATQAWKRERLAAARIDVPAWLTFAAIDFERQTLREGLRAGGFDEARETFFSLLGVVPYLTEDAVWSTLGFIAGTPGSAHVAFDYSDPPGALAADGRAQHLDRASRVAAIGEPWLTHFVPVELHARMRTLGFTRVEDLGPAEVAERYLGAPRAERRAGGHLLYATNVRGQ